MPSSAASSSQGGVLARLERHPGRTFAALGVLFAVAYVAAVVARPGRTRVVDGDAIQYYAYLRSAVFDGDLDFTNDYTRLYGDSPESSGWLRERTAADRPRNMMSVGPALLWSPLYLAVVAAGALLSAAGAPVIVDGYAAAYPLAAGVAGVLYAALGAYCGYRAAALRFPPRAAFWGALLAWLASPAIYYSLVSPAYSHAVSLFTVALFVLLWLQTAGAFAARRFALLGLAGGLAAIVRWQDVAVVALPLIELAAATRARRVPVGRAIVLSGILGSLVLLMLVPQFAAWRAIYGAWFVVPQGSGFMKWTEPAVVEVLFSTRHGLLMWTPALALAVAGWFWLLRRDALLGAGTAAVFALSLYINAAASDWWAGEAFGARRFVGSTVFFALGFAALGARLGRLAPAAWLRAAAVTLVVYNALFLLQYQLFMRGHRDLAPYPTTVRQILVDRLLLPITLARHWLR
jgi:hypothetical protein